MVRSQGEKKTRSRLRNTVFNYLPLLHFMMDSEQFRFQDKYRNIITKLTNVGRIRKSLIIILKRRTYYALHRSGKFRTMQHNCYKREIKERTLEAFRTALTHSYRVSLETLLKENINSANYIQKL